MTGNDTSEAIKRFYKNQPKHPNQDPEEKIKAMMENDPFHKGGSSDDHGGSGYSTEIAKTFGPQLPDFSRTDSFFVMVIPLICIAVDGITALSVGGGILTGIIGGEIYLASENAKQKKAAKKKEEAEHTKGARQSTENKHEKGQARKKTDKGHEKGDARRPY